MMAFLPALLFQLITIRISDPKSNLDGSFSEQNIIYHETQRLRVQ